MLYHHLLQRRLSPRPRLPEPTSERCRQLCAASLILICFAGLLAFVGPALDDHSGEAAQADAATDQIKLGRRQAMAARAICGENAGYQFDGNTLQCFTHRGAKTITAKVTP